MVQEVPEQARSSTTACCSRTPAQLEYSKEQKVPEVRYALFNLGMPSARRTPRSLGDGPTGRGRRARQPVHQGLRRCPLRGPQRPQLLRPSAAARDRRPDHEVHGAALTTCRSRPAKMGSLPRFIATSRRWLVGRVAMGARLVFPYWLRRRLIPLQYWSDGGLEPLRRAPGSPGASRGTTRRPCPRSASC